MTDAEFKQFHYELVQFIADYLKDKEIEDNIWSISFTLDDIPSLLKYGKWTPYNDSYLGFINNHGDELQWNM